MTSGGGKSRDELIGDLARDIASRLPPEFNVEAISMQYPVKYEDSMNTVLVQECLRYNRLISVMTASLSSIQKALKGLVVMSTELDEMGSSLFNQKVPAMWEVCLCLCSVLCLCFATLCSVSVRVGESVPFHEASQLLGCRADGTAELHLKLDRQRAPCCVLDQRLRVSTGILDWHHAELRAPHDVPHRHVELRL